MDNLDNFTLESYFINKKALYQSLDSIGKKGIDSLYLKMDNMEEFFEKIYLDTNYMRIVMEFIKRNEIPNLDNLMQATNQDKSNIFICYDSFYFKKLKKDRNTNFKRRRFHYKLKTIDIELVGEFSEEHFTCNTATLNLSGRYKAFMLGYIQEISESEVVARPLVIADVCLKSNNF